MPDKHTDNLKFAALVAHQLKSPIATVSTILKTLLGEFAGPLNEQQKDLLTRASARCDQAIETARRMLAIVSAMEAPAAGGGQADLAVLLARSLERWNQEAFQHDIALRIDVNLQPAPVACDEAALNEALDALVNNAIKYTPDNGHIHVVLEQEEDGGTGRLGDWEKKQSRTSSSPSPPVSQSPRLLRLTIADSGVGIPPADLERVFDPFYRTPGSRTSTRPGTGLGLTFVKAIVDASGGSIKAGKSAELGGAEITLTLPLARQSVAEKGTAMPKPFKVVIVGGVAAGPKAASKIIRLRPDAEVTVVEKGKFLSYAGCGLPYYISGIVKDQKELMSEPVGTLRDSVFFQKVKNVQVLNQTEAMEIDRAGRRVRVLDRAANRESWLEYDKLLLATGASPIVPQIPGVKLRNIFTLHGVSDAEGIKAALAEGKARDVVIVGGGLIGVEVTEALVAKGCRVSIVEMRPQILQILDWEIAKLVEHHMEAKGVKVLTNTKVTSFQGEDRVTGVVTDKGTLHADLVILGIGVRPNVNLARSAGLEIGTTGALKVDEGMRTSDPDIYAAGDCVECNDLITGKPFYAPLGSTANKQGRVAAVNMCGGSDRFPGVLGTTLCRIFDYTVGKTGLPESAARRLGYSVVSVLAPAPDRAHYMPTSGMLMLKLVADAKTGKLLGVQATGPGQVDKRIDVSAMALTAGMTVDQLANADLGYAPPYSPVMDNLITAANIARNKIAGDLVGISPMEVHRLLADKKDVLLLDVRSPGEHEQVRLQGSTLIPLGSLRGRLGELPHDKLIVVVCGLGLRAYEAELILRWAGFTNVAVMDGGIAMWPYAKVQ